MREHILIPVALLGCALLASGKLHAQDAPEGEEQALRRYAVEVILFRYADSVPAGNEVFRPDPPPESATDTLLPEPAAGDENNVPSFGDRPEAQSMPEPEPSTAMPDEETDRDLPLEEIILPSRRIDLLITPREELTLRQTWDKLELLDAYQPVLWSGWSQAVIERERTPSIALRRLGNAPAGFDGELQLYRGRFLHLVVDLTLTPRQENARRAPAYGDRRGRFEFEDNAEAGLVRLHIAEDRIVKNGDLRYFDHPKFGLLARITRVEKDAGEETEPLDNTEVLPATEK